MKINMKDFGIRMFFILAFLCINICEFVKNIYFLFAIAVLLLIFSLNKKTKFPVNNYIYIFCFVGLVLFAIFNNPAHSITKSTIIKYIIFVFIMIVMSLTESIDGKYIKYGAIFGYIHVIATYFFLIFPNLYSNFALEVYGYYPIGTSNGTLGYTAGLTSHYSSNALYITGCIFALLYLNRCNKKSKIIKILLFLAVGALFLTGKRAHILFTILSMIIIFLIDNRKNMRQLINKIIVIAIICLAMLLIIYLVFPRILSVFQRFEDGLSGRDEYWGKEIEWFKTSPMTGIGWLQFGQQYKVYNYGTAVNTHNVYLQLLCECGIVGFTLFIIAIIKSLKTTLIKYTHCDNNEKNKYYYSLLIQIFFILYCLTGNCLYDNTLFYYSIASGIGMSIINYNENKGIMKYGHK